MSSIGKSIHVAAACDETYAMPLAAMLSSISTNLSQGRGVTVSVLGSRIATETKKKVEQFIVSERMEVSWLTVDHDRLRWLRGTLRSYDTVSIESYYRLLLPEFLPRQLDKVIYLDCDLVVNHNLGELWDQDVGDSYLLAVPEFARKSRYVSSKAGIRLHKDLGLPARLKFFNAGVMVINLRKWRKEHLTRRALTYLREARHDLRWHDQEGLNVVVAADWRELDPRWNVTMHLFQKKSDGGDHKAYLRDPFIVHYNSAIKPWHPDFSFGFQDLFFQHLDRTAWTGWRPAPSRSRLLPRLGQKGLRAIRKRHHAVSRYLQKDWLRWHRWRVLNRPSKQLDGTRISKDGGTEIRAFIVCESPSPTLAYILSHCFKCGADRAFLAFRRDSIHALPTPLPVHERVHLFAMEPGDRLAHETLRNLLHDYGEGHWCLLTDSNELLLYPHEETLPLRGLCAYLDTAGFEAMTCHVLTMVASPDSPKRPYREGEDPRHIFPYFDPRFECISAFASDPLTGRVFPSRLLVGIAEDRAGTGNGWRSKVPLLKFRRDLHLSEDLRAVHGARLTNVEGALLRFQHANTDGTVPIHNNASHEATRHVETLAPRDKDGTHTADSLAGPRCAQLRDTVQLLQLGIMRSHDAFDDFAKAWSQSGDG